MQSFDKIKEKIAMAKNALEQMRPVGEKDATLYVVVHQRLREAAEAVEAAKAEAEERLREAEKTAEAAVEGERDGD